MAAMDLPSSELAAGRIESNAREPWRFELPADALGAELVWWRETGSLHTLVTISGAFELLNGLPAGTLHEPAVHLAWLDLDGRCLHRAALRMLPDDTAFLDSRHPQPAFGAVPILSDGMLVLWVSAQRSEQTGCGTSIRLFLLLDWFSDAGDAVCMHNDQACVDNDRPTRLTEIAILETARSRNALVFLNGARAQAAGSLALVIVNAEGAEQHANYDTPMPAFSRHVVWLGDLFPRLVERCGGRHVSVSDRFDSRGLYTRPYLIT